MKKTFLISVLSLIFSIGMNATVTTTITNSYVEDKRDIDLQGETEDDETRTLNLYFTAYQSDNNDVFILSYANLTNVTITIHDALGNKIETQTLSVIPQQAVSFNTSCYPASSYTLQIRTSNGIHLTGHFDI